MEKGSRCPWVPQPDPWLFHPESLSHSQQSRHPGGLNPQGSHVHLYRLATEPLSGIPVTPYTSASHVCRMAVKDLEGEVLFGPGMHLIIPLEGPLPLLFAVVGSLYFPDSPKKVSFFPRALPSALLRPRPISPTHSHPSCHPPLSHCASQHILFHFFYTFPNSREPVRVQGVVRSACPLSCPHPLF